MDVAAAFTDPADDEWARLRGLHAGLSPVDVEFREMARHDPDCLAGAERARQHPAMAMLGFAPQPWPLFVSRRLLGKMAAAGVAVSNLVRSLPERLFGNDAVRLATCFGVDPTPLHLGLRRPNGLAEALSRGDFLYGPDGFQCVELNLTSNLGGWEGRLIAELAFAVAPIRGFVQRLGQAATFRDPFRQLALYVVRDLQAAGLVSGGEVNIALTFRGLPGDRGARLAAHLTAEYSAALAGLSPPLSGHLWLCHPDALAMRQGALYHGDSRVHAVVDHEFDRVEPAPFRCFKAGTLRLYNAPITMLLSDKRSLALLSENAESDAFTAEERRTIARHVPWSRRLLPGAVTSWQGERADLERLALARRAELVLKRGRSTGGSHVLLGRATAAAEWESAVRRALAEGGWIVQRIVASHPFLFQSDGGCRAHDVVWGPFVFGSRFAGMNLRVQPRDRGGIVNGARGATTSVLLEVADEAPPRH